MGGKAERGCLFLMAIPLDLALSVCLILTVTCQDYRGLYAQRFFLGLLESGISPMFMLIVGSWYKKDEQAMRMGIWYLPVPLQRDKVTTSATGR